MKQELTEQDVMAHLAGVDGSASLREMAHALDLRHHGRRDLKKIVARLKRRKQIEEVSNGRYALAGKAREVAGPKGRGTHPPERKHRPATGKDHRATGQDANLVAGRIVTHRDGYGFVVPDAPLPGVEGDLFIPPDAIGDAMHGDRVLARIARRSPDGRAEGRVVRIAERAHPTVVGIFHFHPRGNYVVPLETRLRQDIVVPPGQEIPPGREAARRAELDGAVVNVEVTRYPRGGASPAGRVVEILGRKGELGIDVEIIVRKHRLPHVFPEEVQAEAAATAQQVSAREVEGRRDFRALPIVTIDGETAKDFDDAVHVARLPNGGYELQVHIADVAHYVRRGSPLDREARLRGTSVYFPDRAVPMLPEALSSGICSLNPKVDRLVMSAVMEIDAKGETRRAEFTPGVIRSSERMTYTNVNRVLEGDAETGKRYAALAEHFRLMKELALAMNARRSRLGSIDFDLPEPFIEFDELGRMVKIVRSERNIAHRIIEEFMLAANQAVAQYLERRGLASLHRVHEKPDAKKVLEFEELARAFGYSLGVADLAERRVPVKHGRVRASRGGRERPMEARLPVEEIDIRPQHYQRLTEKIAGKPEERILSYLMLRSLKQARYAADPLGHFALAFSSYTHFTSPIRRYPDLIVHRVLKWALEKKEAGRAGGQEVRRGGRTEGSGPYAGVELEEIADESSEAERRADGAERELMDWKTAQFMEQHLGEEFDALVISVQKFGFFVELLEVFVEGLVPVAAIEEAMGERSVYRERDRAIVAARGGGKGKKIYRLGDRVRVRVDRIDPFRMRTEFSLVGS